MTKIEILAPYLPYGIEVQHTDCFPPEKVIGLCYNATELVNVEYSDKPGRNYWYGAQYCLPVLFGFADLCTPLADGTVPAVEVAKIQFPSLLAAATARWIPAKTQGYVLDEYGRLLVYFTQNFYDNELSAKSFNYLRRNHFAVGLTAEQYIRKQAV